MGKQRLTLSHILNWHIPLPQNPSEILPSLVHMLVYKILKVLLQAPLLYFIFLISNNFGTSNHRSEPATTYEMYEIWGSHGYENVDVIVLVATPCAFLVRYECLRGAHALQAAEEGSACKSLSVRTLKSSKPTRFKSSDDGTAHCLWLFFFKRCL
jgi:hypothetical protein